jgi:hypothetical protein
MIMRQHDSSLSYKTVLLGLEFGGLRLSWRDEQVLAQGFEAEGALPVDQLAADQGGVHQSPQRAPQVGRHLQEDTSQGHTFDQIDWV